MIVSVNRFRTGVEPNYPIPASAMGTIPSLLNTPSDNVQATATQMDAKQVESLHVTDHEIVHPNT